MERYKLKSLYSDANELNTALMSAIASNPMLMGISSTDYGEVVGFVSSSLFGFYFDDYVAYCGEDANEVADTFEKRMFYDVLVKLPYWYKKYNYIKDLLASDEYSLLQTSKMTSSSNDKTQSAGGTLQKTATTPTGVSAETSPDEINIDVGEGTDEGDNSIETNGFADKYTNAQQKFANAVLSKGERSGEILREGSIQDLLKVLENLPSSFADEITKALQKHFVFDYDEELKCCSKDNGTLIFKHSITMKKTGSGAIYSMTIFSTERKPAEQLSDIENIINKKVQNEIMSLSYTTMPTNRFGVVQHTWDRNEECVRRQTASMASTTSVTIEYLDILVGDIVTEM